jgi:signal transduction histidine kinase
MMGPQHKTYILTILILCLCTSIHLYAQNNPYKIDDALYRYLDKCMRVIKQKEVLDMADTLFNMAKKKKDVKAQCLAKNLKGEYYYCNNDIEHLKIEKENVRNFAIKTPYKQYVFSIWNRVIAYYLTRRMLPLALNEIRNYQKEAIRLNDSYGIGNSYRKLADYYTVNNDSRQALQELKKAEDYFQNNGKENELFNIHAAIATAYYNLSDYAKAVQYYILTLKEAPLESVKGGYYYDLAETYLCMRDLNKAEIYAQMAEEWKKHYTLSALSRERECEYYVSYYIQKKEYDKAYEYCDKMRIPYAKKMRMLAVASAQGDYHKAFLYSTELRDMDLNQNNVQQRSTLAGYTALFDKDRIENEKNLLALQNAKLEMGQLKTKEELLAAERQKNLLMLSNTRLELNNKELALQRQKAETDKQRADKKQQAALFLASEQKAKANRLLATVLIISLFIITASFLAYIILRLHSSRQLKKEMEEVKKARNEAEIARNEAVQADNMKTLFLQNMSHEIRTPLNAIVGFSNMLADSTMNLEAKDKEEFAGLIQTNSSMLTTLVNDILDLSSLESGTYKIKMEETDINQLCSDIIVSVKDIVPKNVELRFVHTGDIMLYTDAVRLRQLLTNLLTNACKYTEKGNITLAYEKKDKQIVFSVTDTGCGISAKDAERIFQRFEKLNSFKQGTGLGLNICKRIAGLLHGEIKLDTTYTEGSRFIFIHPIAS